MALGCCSLLLYAEGVTSCTQKALKRIAGRTKESFKAYRLLLFDDMLSSRGAFQT
jgi:hypothetical protein